jgi:outer membrane protein OmpA-like peptidoglycan-associated protein
MIGYLIIKRNKEQKQEKTMKRINVLVLILIITAGMLYSSPQSQTGPASQDQVKTADQEGEENVVVTYDIRKAAIYGEESKLINETDWHCLYYLRPRITRDLYITGAVHMDWKTKFGTDSRVFLNKGTAQNVNDGNIYMILGEGDRIRSGITRKRLGTLYRRKGLIEITCAYEDNAVGTLRNICHPVNIGDHLVPYEPREEVIAKKLEYKYCKPPRDSFEGHVAYINFYEDAEPVEVGTDSYVTIDMGLDVLSIGDWLAFYKKYGEDLPPIIIGTGIVIHTESTNSTVKIMDDFIIIEVGIKAVLIPEEAKPITPPRKTGAKERLPIIEALKDEVGTVDGRKVLEINILYDLNEITVTDFYKEKLEIIREFIGARPSYEVIIRGYCCSIGGLEYNLRLSQKRVENVKTYLINTFGIKQETIETFHYGEKEALFDNTTEEQRRKNRRVNIQVIEKK